AEALRRGSETGSAPAGRPRQSGPPRPLPPGAGSLRPVPRGLLMARWFRQDVGLLRHPKVLALGTPARKLLWLEVVGYCAEYETGGWGPPQINEAGSRAWRAL